MSNARIDRHRDRVTSLGDGAWQAWLTSERERREQAALARSVEAIERQGRWAVARDGKRLLNFMSNDYLGMSCHPDVLAAAAMALQRGNGSTSSRLMAGTDGAYIALEEKLADFHCTGAALVFGSGYLANVGTISTLVGRSDAVLSDRLNHASIIDGCLLSRSNFYRYRHCDVDHLESMLREAERRGQKRKLIVTESVFSMDGDVAPLEQIVELRNQFGAALMVDEAHALGVFGNEGRGFADELGVAGEIDLLVGTFGKAFGSYGAYVAAERQWIDHLVNTARTFMFSTALPPPVIGAVDAALDLVRAANGARSQIRELAHVLREQLESIGLTVSRSRTQIVPVTLGGTTKALAVSRALEKEGVLVRAIRPPTVPQNSSRLRFSLTSLTAAEDVAQAVSGIQRYLENDDSGPIA